LNCASMGNIHYSEINEITAPKFAIYCQVKQR
jgi:hypothetical protein